MADERLPLARYYSADRDSLEKELRWCHKYFGIGPEGDDSLSVYLVPHGSFVDSGPLVSVAFKNVVGRAGDVVLFVGTEHASLCRDVVSVSGHSKWWTPMGCVERDDRLFAEVSSVVPVSNEAFADEHSVENQLPFLQFYRPGCRMVAISVIASLRHPESQLADIRRVAARLSEVVSRHASRFVAVIGTTDYTHAGPNYREMPPPQVTVPDYIRQRDAHVLSILAGDKLPSSEQVLDAGSRVSMCGLGATLLCLELSRCLQLRKGTLLCYAVGSDISDRGVLDQTGFATIKFHS